MRIGIDGSRAFIKQRTGIEEYSYQVIRHLREALKEDEVFLYLRKGQDIDFEIPGNWKVKKLCFPRFWTQIRLSFEILTDSIDSLFIPAHTVPIIHPKKTLVVIHGLEYEFCPEAYSFLERFYMRFVIKNSCRWASKVVCVSENTKKDVTRLYGIPEEKIDVVYEGYSDEAMALVQRSYSGLENNKIKNILKNGYKYLLFIGRIEKRKNILNIIKAFEFVKEKYGIAHKLVLAGKPGFGYQEIIEKISQSPFSQEIVETGYVSDKEKWYLLQKSDVFVFPTLYEGFGLPILEAQKMMVPVVASNVSSIPEVAGGAALYSDPQDFESIGENIYVLTNNDTAREDMVKRGLENVRRFGWADCANSLASIIKEK